MKSAFVRFIILSGNNGLINLTNADFNIVDHAGNITVIDEAAINAILTGTVTADTTSPTISNITIFSNNALDATLAKTNDKITVEVDTNDNLGATVTLDSGVSHILNKSIVDGATGVVGANKTIHRFTDGTETSEVVVPFNVQITDEAGNSQTVSSTTDASSVKFDRTDPIAREVKISATSHDSSAYLEDVPTYYVKEGDTLDLEFQICDYVDSQGNPPTGTFFNQLITMADGGLTGIACTTPEGNTSVWRKWTAQLININGTEGTVTFDIDGKDNVGNILVNISGTTDGSQVVFDKTDPTLPTQILDGRGVQTDYFKHRRNAHYNWTGHNDNLSGIWRFDLEFKNPLTDVPDPAYDESATVIFPNHTHNFFNQKVLPPSDIPYKFWLNVIDKAGNNSGNTNIYTQLYTIGVFGKVTDQDGNPIKGSHVQVVARFGDTCFAPYLVCTDITDENGEYTIITQKDRDYTLNTWEESHFLDKSQIHVAFTDLEKNTQLNKRGPSDNQRQQGNEIVRVTTINYLIQKKREKLISSQKY